VYTPTLGKSENPLANQSRVDSTEPMIRPGFLDPESRRDLIELTRDGSAAHRLARRANGLVLLDEGMSCASIARVLFLDDDTIRTWYQLYQEDGIEGLASFNHEGGSCQLTVEQQDRLKAWITETLPRTTRHVGAWIAAEFGIEYQTRSGLIALLHRLGMEHRKPKSISRKLDPAKQAAFIKAYEALLNQLSADEAVVFADAAHPTHTVRPVGCWGPKETPVAVEQSSGRDRLNIHGAINLETGQTIMKDVLTVDAASTIMLLMAIEAMYPGLRLIHVYLDNARYHHAKLVQAWLARPGCRIKLHFVPAYCPHLNPIERLWGLMHRHITHNKCYASFKEFSSAMLTFLRDSVPENWRTYCDEVTDNFRIINPTEFRIIA
jgi:transposase